MTIKQYTAAGLAGAATIVMFAATPAMACSHPAPKHDVHQVKQDEHKQTDEHKKDCDHTNVHVNVHTNVHVKVVEQKEVTKDVKKDCDHKVVEQKKVVEHKDCDHKKVTKPGKGNGTPAPTPVPTPQVLGDSTQAMPSSLPQTGASDLALLIGLPTAAGAGAAYLRYKLRK